MRSYGRADVRMAGSIEVRILRMEVAAAESATAKRRELLKIKIKALFEANNGEYGYRRMHAALVRGGERCCARAGPPADARAGPGALPAEAVAALADRAGRAGRADIPDLVSRDFTAEQPGQKMVGDITYIPTWEGWLYLATVIDCATRKIVGWAMDDNYKTPLIIDRDRDGRPEPRPPGRCGIPQRPRQQLHVRRVR